MTKIVNETKLILGLQKGDPVSQEEFYKTFIDTLTQWIYFQGAKCQHDVEEILLDTYHRAFKGIEKFKWQSSLKTWLFTIAKRAKIDYYRSQNNGSIQSKDELRYDQTDGKHNPITEPTNQILEGILNKELRNKVILVLNHLSEDHREIIYLRWIDGHKTKEVADILGKTEAAVKMMTSRAMEKLKIHIKNDSYFKDLVHSNQENIL